MFDKLFSLIDPTSSSSKMFVMKSISGLIYQLLEHLLDNYSHDENAYDAAIDSVIQILQEHKSKK